MSYIRTNEEYDERVAADARDLPAPEDPEAEIKAINAIMAMHNASLSKLHAEKKYWKAKLKALAQIPKDAAKVARRELEMKALRMAVVDKMPVTKVAAIVGLPVGSLRQAFQHLWWQEWPEHYRKISDQEGSHCLRCMRVFPPPGLAPPGYEPPPPTGRGRLRYTYPSD